MSSAHRSLQATLHSDIHSPIPQYSAADPPEFITWPTSLEVKSEPLGNTIISPRGYFHISEYHALEGDVKTPIVVNLTFSHPSTDVTFLRLVLGRKALTTTVHKKTYKSGTPLELEAYAPPSDDSTCPSTPIPLFVQALSSNGILLDSVVAGSFCYTNRSHLPQGSSLPDGSVAQSIKSEPISYSLHMTSESQVLTITGSVASSRSGSRPRTSSSRTSTPRSRPGVIASSRQRKKQMLMRTRRLSPGKDVPESHKIILEFATPVESMCLGWEDQEIDTGRRLVRFTSQQEDCRLKISCECITQEEYLEGDVVISCIYRKDTGSCYVTSVDIICLLEGLVGETFEIEEKNRIRRNLEGFRPNTVSKNRSGSENFFSQIMNFPAPKPRNIEKDVKVFDWKTLPQAIDKILSKYSLYVYASDSAESSPSPELVGIPAPCPPDGVLVSAPSLSLPRGCLTRSPFIHSGNTHSSPKPLRGVRAHRHLDIHSAPPISRTISLDSRVSYSGTPLSVASSPRSIASFGETSHDLQPPNFNATNTNHIPVSAQSSFDRAPSPLDLFQSDDFVFGTIQYPGSSLCGHSPPTQFI